MTRGLLTICALILLLKHEIMISFAKPYGFDDEGEMSVPRSPKIHGPASVSLEHATGSRMEPLQCDIEGSPTPVVVWLKDGQEIRAGDPYEVKHDVTGGRAELKFMEPAYADEKKYISGNFTCIAANFLGRVHKEFFITSISGSTPSSSTTQLTSPTSPSQNATTTPAATSSTTGKSSDSDSTTSASTTTASTVTSSTSTTSLTTKIIASSSGGDPAATTVSPSNSTTFSTGTTT